MIPPPSLFRTNRRPRCRNRGTHNRRRQQANGRGTTMDTLKVNIYIRRADAIAAGRTTYGFAEVAIPPDGLKLLSEPAKKWLAVDHSTAVTCAGDDWPTVAAAIEKEAAEAAAIEQKAKEERAKALNEHL